MDLYYLQTDNDWKGPVSREKLIEFVKRGVVKESTVISTNGKSSQTAKQLFGNEWPKIAPRKADRNRDNANPSNPAPAEKLSDPNPLAPPRAESIPPATESIGTKPGPTESSRYRKSYQSIVANRFQNATGILDIFDWKFEKYVTPIIVRITWVICVVLAALAVVLVIIGLIFQMLPEIQISESGSGAPDGRPTIEYRTPEVPFWLQKRIWAISQAVGSLFGIVIFILWTRVLSETVIVIFNIATSLSSIDQKTDDSGEQ